MTMFSIHFSSRMTFIHKNNNDIDDDGITLISETKLWRIVNVDLKTIVSYYNNISIVI